MSLFNFGIRLWHNKMWKKWSAVNTFQMRCIWKLLLRCCKAPGSSSHLTSSNSQSAGLWSTITSSVEKVFFQSSIIVPRFKISPFFGLIVKPIYIHQNIVSLSSTIITSQCPSVSLLWSTTLPSGQFDKIATPAECKVPCEKKMLPPLWDFQKLTSLSVECVSSRKKQ